MRNLLLPALLATLLLLTVEKGFAQLIISAEVRPRTEFRDGFKTLRDENDKPAFFVEQRTRLYFDYREEKFKVYIALQDVRIWGNTSQIYKTDPSLTNIYEGYGQYFFNTNWSIKAGRQAIDYNNARFLGDLDWAQQGRSHDALLLLFDNEAAALKFQLGAAYNQRITEPTHLFGTEYINTGNYKTMQYAWLNKNWNKSELTFLLHNDGQQVAADTSMAYRQTLAGIGSHKIGKITLAGELYYQTGKNSVATNVSALLINLELNYKTSITPIVLGFDYLSGTGLDNSEDNSFQPLYGTNHKFYGFMDYFYVGNFHGQVQGNPSGLIDVYVKTNFKLSENSSLLAHVHHFSSPVPIYEIGPTLVSLPGRMGTEIDLVFTTKASSNIIFNLGYSTMFATETMRAVKNRGDHSLGQHWAWAMLSFKPVIFQSKKED